METISNLFKDLRERISNPFLFSFLAAWCTINWKIIIGLIFYKIDHLKLDGYVSFIDLISKNHDSSHFFLYPTLIAFVYTFGFPIFKNLVIAFNYWARTWGENWNLKISKKRIVSIEKYMQLRRNYEARSTMLEEIIAKESKLIDENTTFNNEILELKNANNSLKEQLKNWAFVNNPQILDGTWRYSYTTPLNDEPVIYEVQINGYQFEILDKNKKMDIQNFHNSYQGNSISFMLQNSKDEYEFFNLRKLDNSLDIIKGTTNRGKQVELRKRK